MHICDACKKKHYLAGNCHIMQSLRDCFPDNRTVVSRPWAVHSPVSALQSNTRCRLLLLLMARARWNCVCSHNRAPWTMEVKEIAQSMKKKKIHGSKESYSTYLVTNFVSVFKLKPSHSLAKSHFRATYYLSESPAAKRDCSAALQRGGSRHRGSQNVTANPADPRWKTWPWEQAVRCCWGRECPAGCCCTLIFYIWHVGRWGRNW